MAASRLIEDWLAWFFIRTISKSIAASGQAEAELKSLNRNLEAKVQERTSELAEVEQRSRLLLESAGEGIFGTNAQGQVTFANPAAQRMLGYEAEDFLGHDVHRLIHHSHKDGSPYSLEQWAERLATADRENSPVVPLEARVRCKDGKDRTVEWSAAVIGERFIAMAVDLSERKRVEPALKGDKERCLEAGMDGYVSKPVKRQTLFAEIDRVVKTQ